MRRNETTDTDRPTAVRPAVRPEAPWRIASVRPLGGKRLHVVFADGTAGEADLEPLLAAQGVEGTPFEALREPRLFEQASVVLGALQWPNGADLAPDAMYDAIRQHGRWTPTI